MKQKWIIKGDTVIVLSGNDKGKFGTVIERKKESVIIQGVNLRKKHMKAREQGQKPGIIDIEQPVRLCKVGIADSKGNLLKKMKIKQSENGGKELVYSKDGADITHRILKKEKKA